MRFDAAACVTPRPPAQTAVEVRRNLLFTRTRVRRSYAVVPSLLESFEREDAAALTAREDGWSSWRARPERGGVRRVEEVDVRVAANFRPLDALPVRLLERLWPAADAADADDEARALRVMHARTYHANLALLRGVLDDLASRGVHPRDVAVLRRLLDRLEARYVLKN